MLVKFKSLYPVAPSPRVVRVSAVVESAASTQLVEQSAYEVGAAAVNSNAAEPDGGIPPASPVPW